MSTHNQCFRAKIRKNVYPSKPQFDYIKVGCKGVFVTRTCFHDVLLHVEWQRFDINFVYNVKSFSVIFFLKFFMIIFDD